MNHALEIFGRSPRTHNCAQSVAAGFGREDLVAEMKDCGGGRAPGGACGALHAALQLIAEDHREEAVAECAAAAGALNCRDIKSEARTPCSRCVEIAAGLVEKYSE